VATLCLIYHALFGNHVLRTLATDTNAVTTVAGLGAPFGSTDATGAAARFYNPTGVAPLGADTVFVTDRGISTVRKITVSTGAVTTVAGQAGFVGNVDGNGTATRFNAPSGLASDGTALYVADTNNHTIRKFVPSTGAVTTYAGMPGNAGSADGASAAASFRSPLAVAYGGSSKLYVADSSNYTVRQIDMATGEAGGTNPRRPSPFSGAGVRRRLLAVENVRGRTKADLPENTALPRSEVDPAVVIGTRSTQASPRSRAPVRARPEIRTPPSATPRASTTSAARRPSCRARRSPSWPPRRRPRC
jgi:hypothetical protein